MKGPLKNCLYRLTVWPLAIGWHVRTCTKRAIFIEAMFWGAGPLENRVPSSWGPVGEIMSGFNTGKNWTSDQLVLLQLLDTINLRTAPVSLFALVLVQLRAKWMISAEQLQVLYGASFLYRSYSCLHDVFLAFYCPTALAFSFILYGIFCVSL